ncbi:MAG: flagellar hook-basal body complex protein, partial [Acidobacteriota bacterium]|nr:flagellar hook-basal body complex protein [Acidobacteriota bacterium]
MALTSFFSALTGLNSNSHTINVIGDNLANLNTIGFKAGKATFAEIIGGMSGFSATGNPIVFGQGSMLNGVVHKQTKGTPEYTGNSTDAMLSGNGYFVVATGEGGIGYTRAGRFQFDRTGGLVSSDGYQLMGYMANNEGKINQATGVEPLEIRLGQFVPATKTSIMQAAVNLDSQTPNTSPGNTVVTPIEVFDSLGAKHVVQLTFTKVSVPGDLPQWTMSAAVLDGKGNPVPMTIDGNPSQTLDFEPNGTLKTAVLDKF